MKDDLAASMPFSKSSSTNTMSREYLAPAVDPRNCFNVVLKVSCTRISVAYPSIAQAWSAFSVCLEPNDIALITEELSALLPDEPLAHCGKLTAVDPSRKYQHESR